jgi:uncharacterized lipoprotein YajG
MSLKKKNNNKVFRPLSAMTSKGIHPSKYFSFSNSLTGATSASNTAKNFVIWSDETCWT